MAMSSAITSRSSVKEQTINGSHRLEPVTNIQLHSPTSCWNRETFFSLYGNEIIDRLLPPEAEFLVRRSGIPL
jgi:hypothetical protein